MRVSFGTHPAKYNNKKTEIDGVMFDSKKEAKRWRELQLLESSGRVRNLRRQVKYELRVGTALICRYTADYVYEEMGRGGAWESVTEDCKGYLTPVYRLKRKLMQAIHGITIRET